jgi:hypothetical protein
MNRQRATLLTLSVAICLCTGCSSPTGFELIGLPRGEFDNFAAPMAIPIHETIYLSVVGVSMGKHLPLYRQAGDTITCNPPRLAIDWPTNSDRIALQPISNGICVIQLHVEQCDGQLDKQYTFNVGR